MRGYHRDEQSKHVRFASPLPRNREYHVAMVRQDLSSDFDNYEEFPSANVPELPFNESDLPSETIDFDTWISLQENTMPRSRSTSDKNSQLNSTSADVTFTDTKFQETSEFSNFPLDPNQGYVLPSGSQDSLVSSIAKIPDSPSPEQFILTVKCQHKQLMLLADTGSQISLLKPGIIPSSDLQLNSSTSSLLGITGHSLHSYGTATLPISIGSRQELVPFHVCEITLRPSLHGIIGLDGLRQFDISLHVKDSSYSLPAVHRYDQTHVRLLEDTTLFPQQESIIPARVTDSRGRFNTHSSSNEPLFLDCNTVSAHPNIRGANLLCFPDIDNSLPVRLLHLGDQPITLPQGTIVAKVEKIDSSAPSSPNSSVEILPASEHHTQPLDFVAATSKAPPAYASQLRNLLLQYADIFSKGPWDIGTLKGSNFEIDVQNAAPVFTRQNYIPYSLREEANRCVSKLLQLDVIEECKSPWSSPVLLVKSKDNSFRFCIDYRKVNCLTRKDRYPLKSAKEIFDQLKGSTVFSLLDFRAAFNQCQVNPSSRPITAFTLQGRQYQYKKIPFGLSNSPSAYTRYMNDLFTSLEDTAFAYLDDLLIRSPSFTAHLNDLKRVFEVIRRSGMKLNLAKCKWMLEEVTYLGHTISKHGIRPCPSKIQAILDYPRPTTLRGLLSTLGLFGYYRRHIKDYSTLAAPLTDLTSRKTNEFFPNIVKPWTEKQEQAFQALKKRLVSRPILRYPDFNKSFYIMTDASLSGLSGILSQFHDGKEVVIAYASRRLRENERNYSIIELETLAVLFALQQFKQYVYGRHFHLITDSKSLLWLNSMKETNSKLWRWSMLLAQYDFTVSHRTTKQNANCDALSRSFTSSPPSSFSNSNSTFPSHQPLSPSSSTTELCAATDFIIDADFTRSSGELFPVILVQQLKTEQLADSELKQIITRLKATPNPSSKFFISDTDLLCRRSSSLSQSGTEVIQYVIPTSLQQQVLTSCHTPPIGLHYGADKTLQRLRKYAYWQNMQADVTQFCDSCLACKKSRLPNPTPRAPTQPIDVPTRPWSVLHMDCIGPLTTSLRGNRYILVCVDYLTRYTIAIPMKSLSAKETADKFVRHVIYKYGNVEKLVSDNGRNFIAEVFRNVCSLLRVTQVFTSIYHPQSNATVERFNKTIGQLLRATLNDTGLNEWDRLLPALVFLYNTTTHRSTNETPHFLLFGREANVNFTFEAPPTSYQEELPYAEYLKRLFPIIHAAAKTQLQKSQALQRKYRAKIERPVSYKPGDKVLVKRTAFPPGQPHKLYSKYVGPFTVTNFRPPGNLTISDDKHKLIKIHSDRCIPFSPREFEPPENTKPTLSQPTVQLSSHWRPPPVTEEEPTYITLPGSPTSASHHTAVAPPISVDLQQSMRHDTASSKRLPPSKSPRAVETPSLRRSLRLQGLSPYQKGLPNLFRKF